MHDRWFELRQGHFSTESLHARIEGLASQVAKAADRNFSKWEILNRNISFNPPRTEAWREQTDLMKQCVADRAEWNDNQILDQGRPRGDFDRSGTVDDVDIDLVSAASLASNVEATLDLNRDGKVGNPDRIHLTTSVLGALIGDSNLDG